MSIKINETRIAEKKVKTVKMRKETD